MIHVEFLGHIKTSMNADAVDVDAAKSGIRVSGLFEIISNMVMTRTLGNVGFNRFNTLVVVNDGEVFCAASDDRLLSDGDRVLLVPFSHGG